MNLAFVLTHNKSDDDNFKQIDVLKSFIEVISTIWSKPNEEAIEEPFESHSYTIKGLAIHHEAKFYQVVPYGIKIPSNIDDIDSRKVYYGEDDQDKIGDHPRFFNWGLARGSTEGAEAIIFIDDITKFSAEDLQIYLEKLTSIKDTVFIETPWGKIATLRLASEVGQLDESKEVTTAITDLKQRVVDKGLKNG